MNDLNRERADQLVDMNPNENDNIKQAFRSPEVRHFLELAATAIVAHSKRHLVNDRSGTTVFASRLNASEHVELFDSELLRPVRCRIRIKMIVEPDPVEVA